MGITANGLDMLQHSIHLFLPDLANMILMIAGIFHIPWFVLVGLDFLKISKEQELMAN
jgi:hypothetical protein